MTAPERGMEQSPGRRALVTGGGRGIGREIALALARRGVDIAIVARTASEVQQVALEARALGRKAVALCADVTKPEDVRRMAEDAARDLGPVDILVNGAGAAESAPLRSTDLSMWERALAVNLTSVYLCTSALLPSMISRGWGRVINVASQAGLTGFAYVSAYCAAKHGVIGFTRAVALEVGAKGVTINAVCPGYVDTDMTRLSARNISEKTGVTQEQAMATLARFNPSGRLLRPEEVAEAALRLAADDAAGINGQAVPL